MQKYNQLFLHPTKYFCIFLQKRNDNLFFLSLHVKTNTHTIVLLAQVADGLKVGVAAEG